MQKEDNDWMKNWSMKWRVSGQEVDQRKLGERQWKRLSSMWIEQGVCHGSLQMNEADKGHLMTTVG